MDWINFPIYTCFILIIWMLGLLFVSINSKRRFNSTLGNLLLIFGVLMLIAMLSVLWINLERPPLRTLGETRLWYSIFLSVVGLIFYWRWKYNWFLVFSFSMSGLFIILNIIYPENFNKSLMPALHSGWFVPHVVVYIISYALLGASSIVAVKQLFDTYVKGKSSSNAISLADNLVYLGFSFLTMGLLFGALWAKEAWGHYWTWDPKETWAFLTWSVYLIYIHGRIKDSLKENTAMWVLAFGFIILLICWFGVNYLPSTANSVHTYSKT
ncbi:MAG: cytochrome c biogenesis protein CcsA [Lentimicrobiaceae bacterium]|nr:cytochrome c biogenesis protein CcsA [Lentimicrobiaceae bacterium]MCP4910287.1 cytochrome c biogenesis protein CcsA [Bacteroidota bacterium]MBT3453848.1 cytochrome c biogenesis protein CcsA [Lentimicrobiaceae bacterium]MBT3818954.1 cytochrome c biogenesis protein CcsA [Lentimicrobiaceae bacterium]MBT4060722.1 cytochrome c biogenesis protein CcsA [Lentimicrobiaceae bacterium]